MRVEHRNELGWHVYRDGELTHFAGANPGTPYTWCGLDAGAMLPDFHRATNAAVWCTDCLKAGAARLDANQP